VAHERVVYAAGYQGTYLLMPAEQHAHSLTASLSSASRVYLRETSCLWGNIARTACWSGLCHALVSADQDVSQTARKNCILLYSLLRVMILHGEESRTCTSSARPMLLCHQVHCIYGSASERSRLVEWTGGLRVRWQGRSPER
jgi:hypothetical protein